MKTNQNYQNLQESYLFATVAQKIAQYKKENPDSDLIRLDIGDVTQPLPQAVIEALHAGVDDMATADGFHGYGPYEGYAFLREAIAGYYHSFGTLVDAGEIFVSDGAKSDIANILDIFGTDNTVLIPDPVYPVYVDTNIMAGRRVRFLDANEQNGFTPLPDPTLSADLIYLCSPNNPTGAVYTADQLQAWVDYANDQDAVILFDAAYEAFVRDPALPRSIFSVPGARTCAIEFCSLSKTAGFTGTRCGYTVIPKELSRGGHRIYDLWLRRQSTKFNGVPYIIQRGAAAVFSPEGQRQVQGMLDIYMQNAAVLTETLRDLGIWFCGGQNAPYLWLRCPGGMDSWAFFDHLLTRAGLTGTPGAGFGKNGAGFFRLTAFGDPQRTLQAAERLRALL